MVNNENKLNTNTNKIGDFSNFMLKNTSKYFRVKTFNILELKNKLLPNDISPENLALLLKECEIILNNMPAPLIPAILGTIAYSGTIKNVLINKVPVSSESFIGFAGIGIYAGIANGLKLGSTTYFTNAFWAILSVIFSQKITYDIEKLKNTKNDPQLKGLIELMSKKNTLCGIYTKEGKPIYINKYSQDFNGYTFDDYEKEYIENGDTTSLIYKGENAKFVKDALGILNKTGEGYTNKVFIQKTKTGEDKAVSRSTQSILDGKYNAREGIFITDKDDIEKKLEETLKLVEYDCLTGAYSIHSFNNDFNKLQDKNYNDIISNDGIEEKLFFTYIDIDNFKKINDTLGHEIGDEILKIFKNIFTKTTYNEDKLYRLGGDEFCMIYRNTNNTHEIIKKIDNLKNEFCNEIKKRYNIDYSGLSIGTKQIERKNLNNKTQLKKEIDDGTAPHLVEGIKKAL